ncbi:erythrulose kinase [Actinomycetota bacterium]|nr:erythrulose kinase [Actinomycetota bacterium]
MTRLVNDPGTFAGEAVDGLAAAYGDHVLRVHGGVVRAATSPPGEVALVLGGGSGHYPAFAGWVGPGMAHGATCGNVFASPAASQVYSVVRAADNGGGVLLGFGNYAGDVLHFGQAAERLRAEGVDVRVVTVTDDVASAPPDRAHERRGIAGDVVVLKIAGAACAAGWDLDAVEAVTRRANDRTRSLGFAFEGCTLPGADAPLFHVEPGTMALGLGIHGEPGIDDAPLGSADEVADRLVDGLLAEQPERGEGYDGRVAVVLNGLGGTKYEELFVVFGRVARRLRAAGLTPVAPLVGELVTSLDMAGLSLTLTFLDPELERLWLAPVDTPALHRAPPPGPRRTVTAEPAAAPVARGSAPSRRAAAGAVAVLGAWAQTAAVHQQELGDLDAVAGDGDHGQGMVLGSAAAHRSGVELRDQGVGIRSVLLGAGAAWSEGAGGTSGALWGAMLTAAGASLSDQAPPQPRDAVTAVLAAADAVLRLGGARPGDKTLVDALAPFADTLAARWAQDVPLAQAWRDAARAAADGADATAALSARLGRARTHGERSKGHRDPGAVSFALLVAAATDVITELTTGEDR